MNLHREGALREEEIPPYTLPELLQARDGTPIANPAQWEARREEILDLFREHVYGYAPGRPPDLRFETIEEGPAFDGAACRKQVDLVFANGRGAEYRIPVLLYRPVSVEAAPAFICMNHLGNQATTDDPAVRLTRAWVADNERLGIVHHRATESSRGVRSASYPIRRILERGAAFATLYKGDVDPDYDDGFANGVHPCFDAETAAARKPNAWGTIAAWAWGYRRVLDCLEGEDSVRSDRVMAVGHSRLGKTALWAAATDPRFFAAGVNDSGCTGAALSRRLFGETVWKINQTFPHWFCDNYKAYGERVRDLPVDQHMLIACVAPRRVQVASASDDQWADPMGEFLATRAASAVWGLYGYDTLRNASQPAPGRAIGGRVGYHLREGPHGLRPFDWEHYLRTLLAE